MTDEKQKKVVELTDAEIEDAAGGTSSTLTFTCQQCGRQNTVEIVNWGVQPPCMYCNYVNVYNTNPHGGR